MFRQRFRDAFEGDASRVGLYKDVSNGILPAGIEYFLPLFFEKTATLFDYLPADATLLLHGDVPGAIAEFWADLQGRYKMLGGDRSRPVLPPAELFLRDEEFFIAAKALPQYLLKAKVGADTLCVPGIPLRGQVTAIRRRSQRGLRLEPDTTLLEGDVVVLIGDAAAVTAGEEMLLRGR